MRWNRSNFTASRKTIKIEGFQPDRLINKCLQKKIPLRNIVFRDSLTAVLEISSSDFSALKKMAKNTYKITVLAQGGYRNTGKKIWKRKATLAGMLIFAAFFYWQSLYIAEIRVSGYEKIPEHQIRVCMEKNGFYEGCRKDVDLGRVKTELYRNFDEIVWIGITYTGRKADVRIAEGAREAVPLVKSEKPCNIVADKDGYVEEIIPTEGLRAVKDGAFVKKGDVLITGKIPLKSMAYGTEAENATEMYVHAQGEVAARIPQRLVFYGERYLREKRKTGRRMWGIAVNGHNTVKLRKGYDVSVKSERNLVRFVKPFPLKIDLIKVEEVKLRRREKSREALRKAAEREIRRYEKENLPQKTQILNKDLNFTVKKNIIEIGVTLETLQKIGIEEEIIVGKPKRGTADADKDHDQ